MNVGQFYTRVSQAIKRGSALDDIIPFWAAEACRIQEQNYTFSWMSQTSEETIAGSTSQLVHELDPYVKSVEWVKPRWSSDGNSVWYGDPLVGVDSRLVQGYSSAAPSGYWLEGQDGSYVLKFDAISEEDYDFQLKQNVYTEWPDDDTAVPVFLARGQYVLFCQTLILFAQQYKDARMVEQYSSLIQGAMSSLLRSDEELKLAHQNNLVMQYQGLT